MRILETRSTRATIAPLHSVVELATFVEMLRRLDADDLDVLATAIEDSHRTAADEVAAWEDLMRVDDALRRAGRTRVAARAAHEAVQAVRFAVVQSSAEISDTLVTRIAREAALLARAWSPGPMTPSRISSASSSASHAPA